MSAGDPASSDRLAAIHERLIKTALDLRMCADKRDKRMKVLSLINESYLHSSLTEGDLFAASYGDVSGHEYWRGWCTPDWSPLISLAEILAAHNAKAATVEERKHYREQAEQNNRFMLYLYQERGLDLLKAPNTRLVLNAFAVAQHNRVPWMRGDLLGPPNNFFNEITTRDIEVQRLAAVTWLAQHPDYEAIVPDSLHQFLGTSGSPISVTGVPGRPSSLHLIETDLNKLGTNDPKKKWGTKKALADELCRRFRSEHPNLPPPTSKTIGNALGKRMGELGLIEDGPTLRPK